MPSQYKIICIGDLSDPLEKGGKKKYSIFDAVKDRYGVYVFLDNSNRPLYVGEATGQTLKERIRQNYNTSTGGTYRDNWGERHGGEALSKDDTAEEKAMKRRINRDVFHCALRNENWKIMIMSVPTCGQRHWIHVLEKSLIGFFDPKYNKY